MSPPKQTYRHIEVRSLDGDALERLSNDMKLSLSREDMVEVQKFALRHKPSSVYSLTIVFYFETWGLLNKGWFQRFSQGEHKGKRKAKTMYKRLDVGNRRKLLEDCLAESLGIDDSLTFRMELIKAISPKPHLVILFEEDYPTLYGVPKDLLEKQ